jgi:hypothetical protein
MYTKKINIKKYKQDKFDHRHGWLETLNQLHPFHYDDGVILEGRCDGLLEDNNRYKMNFLKNNPWIGFIHATITTNDIFNDSLNLDEVINNLNKSYLIKHCRGFYVLSNYVYLYLINRYPYLHFNKIYHPTNFNVSGFNLQKYLNNKSKSILHLGIYLRQFSSFVKLETTTHSKKAIILNRYWRDKYSKDTIKNLSKKYIKNISKIQFHYNKLENNLYDNALTESIGFMHLHDASANNSVLECISRNTPLLINKHPAVIEYLGENYPFYFENIEEANAKVDNIELIIKTHEYLKNKDKTFLSYDYFVNSFYNSSIYQNIEK